MVVVLLLLQSAQVAFLWLHDWVPLGRLNDVAAVKRQDSTARLGRVTLIQSLPFTAGLLFSIIYLALCRRYPEWLRSWLWVSYFLLFAGELTAWWFPYLTHPSAVRVSRSIRPHQTDAFDQQMHRLAGAKIKAFP